LIIVLWMAALLALAAAALAASAKVHFQATRNSIESQRAQWLADAGVRLGLRELATAPANGPPRASSPSRVCRLPEGDVLTISIHDEAGKIDLNTADDDLIRALFIGVGVTEPEAGNLIAAITDFRDEDSERTLNGAEGTEYRAAARPAGPKNAPFDAVVEIGSVLGLSSEVFNRIRPHLTVHSGQNGVDPAHATLDLLDILARTNPDLGSTSIDEPRGTFLARDRLIPARFVTASASQAFTVHAQATTVAGSQEARAAVITKLEGARQAVSYRIWQWDRAALSTAGTTPPPNAASLPPC
jgi:general secretion pathway protein K